MKSQPKNTVYKKKKNYERYKSYQKQKQSGYKLTMKYR